MAKQYAEWWTKVCLSMDEKKGTGGVRMEKSIPIVYSPKTPTQNTRRG
jgi:hypothetical protein